MAQVLRRLHNLPATQHPDLIVGFDGADDAGVFRMSADTALVQTVDFFTPIVDDPADWGRIAAANALSDIYAMGGVPLTALQVVGWPRDKIPFEVLSDVLVGAAEVMAAAGVTIVGGHSIDDPEPKVGFAVTGTVHPDRILRNRGGRPGDVLVLTKPIGTGVIATAIKRGTVDAAVMRGAIAAMVTLNDRAGRAASAAKASAVTDVTGFGLLGHLGEMLHGVGAELDSGGVPLLVGAEGLARAGVVPGGTRRNLEHAAGFTDFGSLDEVTRLLLADAQTSGGLLIALAPAAVGGLLATLTREGVFPAVIGTLTDSHPGRIVVR